MKKTILLLILLCAGKLLSAQFVYTIKADSVKITNDCDTAELIIENHTQDTLGFLYNKGKGRTEFRRVVKLNDSTLLFGEDTLTIGDGTMANNGLILTGKTVQLGQAIGSIGNPAALTSNREIPTNDHYLVLKQDDRSLTLGSSELAINGNATMFYTAPASIRMTYNNNFENAFVISKDEITTAFTWGQGLGSLRLHDLSGNVSISSSTGFDLGARLAVDGTGLFTDTLTATTMGNADSSNRVATTAYVKSVMGSPVMTVVAAGTSDLTAVAGTFTKLPDLSGAGSHSVTLPSASSHAGERIYLWNMNSSGNSWTFSSAITLPDGTTSTSIANQTTIELISDGSAWIKFK